MEIESVVAHGQLLSTRTLSTLELFRGEDLETLDWVLHSCGVRTLVPGEKLLDPDCANDSLYILLTGRAEVRFIHDDSTTRILLEPGECAGELSIIDGERPAATVAAYTHCLVLIMDANVIWTLIDRSSVVASNLLHIISARMRRNNQALVKSQVQQRIYKHEALTDSLTGLYNRRWVESDLLRIVERYARVRESLALLMIDADHFKNYNDTHGHLAGDILLAFIARAISQSVRSIDYSCRFGGDEFVVVLPRIGSAEAQQIAEEVCRSVREQPPSAGENNSESTASVSVGIALLGPGMNMWQLLASADAALYRAKADRRGAVSH